MNVLFLPKYGPLAASARYRFLQYIPFLEQNGVRCTVSPLFDDRYLEAKFRTGRAPARSVLAALSRRTAAMLRLSAFDLTVLAYEAFPYIPGLFERYMRSRRASYLYDYDDAIFHNYDQHRSPLVRRLLGGKIRDVIAGASGVLAGSEYLASYARQVNRQVELLPTVIDLARYPARPAAPPPGRPFTIGWIGSPSTAAYLPAIAGALRTFCAERGARLLLIGSGPVDLPGVPTEVRPWREAAEVEDLCEFDVGIMPLPDTPWARGKCGFKLIQYMACFVPVIASPVGANHDIVSDGVSGFLCGTTEEWLQALRALGGDPALRARVGRAGRAVVEARYCLGVTAPRLLSMLRRNIEG